MPYCYVLNILNEAWIDDLDDILHCFYFVVVFCFPSQSYCAVKNENKNKILNYVKVFFLNGFLIAALSLE